ncbi:MAG: hypothetical protein LBL34_04340 [Clostridiales bacterium]|jgi:hypothetical protein|nr:hypothetical protein [Clostridiales bacterium]
MVDGNISVRDVIKREGDFAENAPVNVAPAEAAKKRHRKQSPEETLAECFDWSESHGRRPLQNGGDEKEKRLGDALGGTITKSIERIRKNVLAAELEGLTKAKELTDRLNKLTNGLAKYNKDFPAQEHRSAAETLEECFDWSRNHNGKRPKRNKEDKEENRLGYALVHTIPQNIKNTNDQTLKERFEVYNNTHPRRGKPVEQTLEECFRWSEDHGNARPSQYGADDEESRLGMALASTIPTRIRELGERELEKLKELEGLEEAKKPKAFKELEKLRTRKGKLEKRFAEYNKMFPAQEKHTAAETLRACFDWSEKHKRRPSQYGENEEEKRLAIGLSTIQRYLRNSVDKGLADRFAVYNTTYPPAVERSAFFAQLALYEQLEEMSDCNLDKTAKIPERGAFLANSLADNLKQTFFYRDYLFKAPEGEQYYIFLPTMKINGGLEGLKISTFAVGEEIDVIGNPYEWDKTRHNTINLSGSGAVIDVSDMQYLLVRDENGKEEKVIDLRKCDFNGCEVIGRISPKQSTKKATYSIVEDSFAIEEARGKHLPIEYLERRRKYHLNAEGEYSIEIEQAGKKLLEKIVNKKDLKRTIRPDGINLIDYDLSQFGGSFEYGKPGEWHDEVSYCLHHGAKMKNLKGDLDWDPNKNEKWNPIPYSFRNEAVKNRYAGECLYHALTDKWGFEFDKTAVVDRILEREDAIKMRMSEVNPTIQAYAFDAALEQSDYKFLMLGWCADVMENDVRINEDGLEKVKKDMAANAGKGYFPKRTGLEVMSKYIDYPNPKEDLKWVPRTQQNANNHRDFFDRFAISESVKSKMFKHNPDVIMNIYETAAKKIANEQVIGGD